MDGTRTQSKTLNDRPRNGDAFSIDQPNRRSGAERHMSRNSANPDEIVFAPPRINFSSSRVKLLDGDKAAKELEQGRFGIRSSDNDRARDGRGNALRRRGDSDFDGEGWSTVKPRKSFGAEGAERFAGKMGGNYRDEVKSTDRDANRERQSKTTDTFGRDKDRDADGRTRNGLGRKMEPWAKSESNVDGAAPERRDRDRTKSWRDRDAEPVTDNRAGDKRWGRDRDQRAERDPEWFDEPAKEQRDVHTQQDFQKWMEQMKKAKNAQENQAAETPEPEKPEKPAKSTPVIEQGPDKFFMAFGGGTTIDSQPQVEPTEGASKPKPAGKSSRFTSFFGGGQEEPRQHTESSTPATAAPSVPPGFAHLFGGMTPASARGGSTGPDDEKQAFAQLLAKLQKQTVSATPPGLSLFSPPQQNANDSGKKSAVASPEPFQQYGNDRREGPTARPPPHSQQEIHAPRPQQQNPHPDQLLQDLVGHHHRASSQSSTQRDPLTATKNNSNAEFLMNLMRAPNHNAQRAEQLQNMMAHGGHLQQKPSSMSPMNERDVHAHQQQGRPGPPPGFPALDDSFRSPDSEPRPNPTQILQRPPPPPGLDHMPPNWMNGPFPPGPPPGQRGGGGGGGPMIPPPGLPGGLPNRNMPMPHMFPPNFPPGAMPPPPPHEMRGSMHMPPPGFFNGPPPPHAFGPPPGMPNFNGPPPPDPRAYGSPPFDARGMVPPPNAGDAGRNGGGYGRQ
ncbi:hypothetical protein ISF_01707 [Cordyceps fumosorosea ARSEF 2679]|uniref:Uncharacterized protein n=1 Tax=Cordyceps fumosorosea (strain ARSEF 2679) TaxID=1081104 RepID=A0A168CAL6_CORFA|nr:hypothetical protein ISF_01707 [Cordyceps fumosorosea ARSEF 2679]OAA71156.1 hypothetical protein ISF_01707 [Cordyceps fumosorosea ARSEF 2679]